MSFPGRSDMFRVVEAHKSVDLDGLLRALLERVYKRRLRLKERFVEFDSLRTGAISVHKFRTALSIAGLDDLSDKEYATLAAAYAGPTPDSVKYIDLINYLEQAFVVPDMERYPAATVPVLAAASIRKPLPTLSDAQEAEVAALIARMRKHVLINRLAVKQPFDDFARGSGTIHRVTRSQFRQVLGWLHIELTNAEAELLCAKLDTHNDRTCNYLEFAVLVDPSVAAALPPALGGSIETKKLHSGFRTSHVASAQPNGYQPGRPPVTLDEPRLPLREPPPPSDADALAALLRRCAEKVATNRVRLVDFFADYDKGRSGKISIPAFRTALSIAFDRLCIELTEAEFVLVATRYAASLTDGSAAVRWRAFIDDIEELLAPPRGIEQAPLMEPVQHAVCASDKLRPPPAGREAEWEALRARIRKQTADRSLLLRPPFDDLSRTGTARLVDHVTRTQFQQGLVTLGLSVSRDELEILFHRYDTARDSTVHYVLFAAEMDDYETFSHRLSTWNRGIGDGGFNKPKTFAPDPNLPYGTYVQPGRAEPTADVPRLPGTPTPPVEPGAIVRELQLCARRYGIRVSDFFVDFDRHRSRKLSPAHFRIALRGAFERRLALSEAQVVALIRAYAAGDGGGGGGSDAQPTLVRWRDFADDVDAAFGVKELERTPLAAPSFLEEVRALPEVTAEELALVEAVLERFSRAVRQRSLALAPQLRDFERSARSPLMVGRVTQTQFRQALGSAQLELTNGEFAALVKRFDTRRDGSVDYVQFVHLVDPSEAHQLAPGRAVRSTCGYHHPRVLEPASRSAYQPGRPPTSLDQPRLLEKPSSNVADLVSRMRNKTLVLRLRVEDAFRDHDHLNSGCVSVEHFRSAISRAFDTASLALTEAEFGLLVRHYQRAPAAESALATINAGASGTQSPPAESAPASAEAAEPPAAATGARKRAVPPGVLLVDWRAFCADVEPVMTGLEKDPLAEVHALRADRALQVLSDEDEEALAQLLASIRHRFVTRRVLLKPFFQDFAHSRMKATVADHVTRKQFRQALSTAGIELPAAQLELLYAKYDDSNDQSINYTAFTRAVDPAETYSDRPAEPRQPFADGYARPRVVLPSQQRAF
ncbi:hypothetical protein KFE25_004686 [Diacronema lutheri]|uniref:EF-hand domain-containing protein n=1 Tax=Diacronema lutheri TaxID=2081491 RepID=A0A8J6CAK8_DIALT|nr:hypothetical protein KFE25_004686 [Diacronema lutheri]